MNSHIQKFAGLYFLLDFQWTQSVVLSKPSPSDSSQINIICDHRQERGAKPVDKKASCNVPQRRTPQTTNCYRLMAPYNIKTLLHRQPLCKPSFLTLCSLFSTGQLDWNIILLLLLKCSWEGSWSKVKSQHQVSQAAINIQGGKTLPKGSSAQRNQHSHLVKILHAELD